MTTPANALSHFLLPRTPTVSEQETWGDLHLAINAYTGDDLPPEFWITSVRCVVLNTERDQVLTLRNEEGGIHLLPGGRRETGEALLTTLHREIMEETGWTIRTPRRIGFIHFHHLTPKPDHYPYPHPDFLQVVYTAQVDSTQPQQSVNDSYETHAAFYPVAKAGDLPLPARDRLYLAAALASV